MGGVLSPGAMTDDLLASGRQAAMVCTASDLRRRSARGKSVDDASSSRRLLCGTRATALVRRGAEG